MSSAFQVQTAHRVIPFGSDRMDLADSTTGDLVASAVRPSPEEPWTVTGASGTASPVEVTSRAAAITALTEAALTELGGTGYSTLIPHGLMDAP